MNRINYVLLCLLSLGFFHSASGAEFFLKVNRSGKHSVILGSIYHMNNTNVFKLFDLVEGTSSFQVVETSTGTPVYTGNINLFKDQRTIAELDQAGNLVIVKNVPVEYENWYTEKCEPPVPKPVVIDNKLTEARYKEIIESIKNESFQQEKLELAKNTISSYTLTVEQVMGIMKEFSFDDEKLDFAKFAYTYTADKDRYDKVSGGLTFSVKKKELNDFVKKQRTKK